MQNQQKRKNIVITGATSGIGKETALLLAENGFNLILTGRREHLLNELKSEITAKFQDCKVLTLCFDVRNKGETEKMLSSIPDDFLPLDALINNAGLAIGLNPLDEGLIEDWECMIDTNIKGLLYVTKYALPLAKESGFHIVNISSIAGKYTYAGNNVYCATKFAVESLSETMRIDFLKKKIKVTNISPGATETEFSIVRFKGDNEKAKQVYNGYVPLNGRDVAETIYFALSRPEHVNINDIVIVPSVQANPFYICKE